MHIALLPNIAGSMEEIGSCGSGDHHIGSGGGSREVESGGKQRQGTGMENNVRTRDIRLLWLLVFPSCYLGCLVCVSKWQNHMEKAV